MAIGYTPQTWVNGSAPALSAANLQTMDNGINAACDALDAMAVDGTGIPDATTAIKGRVALATTGVEEATKVPKATGADLAALLTAGGYTLTAPSGANSLDGIADTATWKKVAAAVATALNADTYTANDADKVSAAGIGVKTSPNTINANLDDFTTGGIFAVEKASTGSNFPTDKVYGTLLVTPFKEAGSGYYVQQFFDLISDHGYIRWCIGGTWHTWYEIFNALSDGNGGQPPAPKPQIDTTGGSGNWVAIPTNGVLASGGKWAFVCSKSGSIYGISVRSGGTDLNTLYGTTGIDGGLQWRIS